MSGLSVPSRVIAGLIALAAISPLAVLATLAPDSSGRGTHTQLGLASCGFRSSHGYDCPTCGFTTASTLAAHGHVISSIVTHPAAGVTSVALAMTFWVGLFTAATGSPVVVMLRGLWRPTTIVLIALLFAGSWAYRVAYW